MTFSGFPFLFGFLPLLLCGFWLFSRFGTAWAKTWLIGTSLLFYAAGAPGFLPLLVGSVIGNLMFMHLMYRSARAGWWSAVAVAANLLVLIWFKYLTGNAVSPLGLSFFTFTQIGCLVFHGGGDRKPPEIRDYALYAAFFPALLAGPILNPRDMLPQCANADGWRLRSENLATGGGFFVIGLLQKALLADPLSTIVGSGFADPGHLSLLHAWQAAAAYSLELYFDFAGYTDMAIGLAYMVGLRFPDNFDRPYRATSVIGYWQRWHMSLTRFLMSNVHAPLTLAVMRWRKSNGHPVDARAQRTVGGFLFMIAFPITTTIMLIAAWHGATATYLLFGALHAGYLLVNHAWRIGRAPSLPPLVAAGLTYLCVLVGAVVFRADSVGGAGAMLAGMIGWHGLGAIVPTVRGAVSFAWLAALYAIVWLAPSTRAWMESSPGSRFGWVASPGWAAVMGCAATLAVLAAGGTGEFLYFRF